MSLLDVNDKSYMESFPSKGVVLVEFGAEWCPPCKVLNPILDQLNSKFDDQITILKVDCDESPQLAAQYGVMSMPTVILFNDGEPYEKLVGLRPASLYEQFIKQYLLKNSEVR